MIKSQNDSSILKPRPLTLEDISWLREMGEINDGCIYLRRSAKGYKLKTPVSVRAEKVLALGQVGLAKYVINSLVAQRPTLIPFVLDNQSLIELAKYFLRYCSGSPGSLYGYVDRIWRYSNRAGKTPDELIEDVAANDGAPRILAHVKALEDYLAELQDQELSPGRIVNYAKAVKTFYRANGVSISLPHPLSRKIVGRYRAPTQEELAKLLEIADLREKVITSMLALGGFREGTLAKLKYRHAKEDLERGLIPLRVHVEMEITKGKYGAYDTFLGSEPAEFLKLYMESRRKGTPLEPRWKRTTGGIPSEKITDGIPPEEITDDSPLIRDSKSKTPRPIGEKQIYKVVHHLYFKAGLITPGEKSYDLKPHSLRKFFKTQLVSKGVPESYAEYMMGHVPDKYGYNDIESKGIEYLRNVYANAAMKIRADHKTTDREMLKKTLGILVKESGLDPDKVIMWDALAEPHRAFVSPEDTEDRQIRALSSAVRESIKREVMDELSLESPEIHRWSGGPAGIRTPDLNRRLAPGGCPAGYQPSAPAKLSYGPH